MTTMSELEAEMAATEGNDCSDYKLMVDVGPDQWRPGDEYFVHYNHGRKLGIIKRRRSVVGPGAPAAVKHLPMPAGDIEAEARLLHDAIVMIWGYGIAKVADAAIVAQGPYSVGQMAAMICDTMDKLAEGKGKE